MEYEVALNLHSEEYIALLDLKQKSVSICKTRGLQPSDQAIIILDIYDEIGLMLAEEFVPEYNWRSVLAQGQTRVGTALVPRRKIQEMMDLLDKEVAAILRATKEIAVVVVAGGNLSLVVVPEVGEA